MPVDFDTRCECAHVRAESDLMGIKICLSSSDECRTIVMEDVSLTWDVYIIERAHLGWKPHPLPAVAFWKGAPITEPAPRARIENTAKNMTGAIERLRVGLRCCICFRAEFVALCEPWCHNTTKENTDFYAGRVLLHSNYATPTY